MTASPLQTSASSAISAVPNLVTRAKLHISEFTTAEAALRVNYAQLYRHAWKIGAVMSQLKEAIGHGKWLIWLPSHFQELGATDSARTENASRCMRFFKDNPAKIGNSRHLEPPDDFSTDSIRKLMWGYIPAKERPQLEGDGPVTRQPHYLTFVNHFSKWNRQRKLGRLDHPPSQEQFQREITPTLVDIIELAGRDYVQQIIAELE